MPDFGISEIIALAGLAASAGQAAYTGYEASQAGSGTSAATSAAQAASQAQADQAAKDKQKAITANLANAQSQTGGALTDQGLTNLSSLIAGYGGAAGGANPNAGSAPSTASTITPQSTGAAADTSTLGLQDFLSNNANFAGGSQGA